MSPKPSLEQSSTYDAIRKLQLITEQFPNSTYADSSEALLDELRIKLEQKAFDNAYLYYKTEYYESASVSFKNVLKRFPDTDFREEILFSIVKSNYKLAVNSVESKKEERFKNTIEAYIKFADSFPESEFLSRAEEFYEEAQKSLEEIKKKNQS
jgi:outer membrane protein assembly factor BamD